MIGRERRGDGLDTLEGATLVKAEEPAVVKVKTPIGPFQLTQRKIRFLLSILMFFVLVNVPFVKGVEANNCIAILTFCTVLWATEAIPLFVTSLFVPLLLILYRCIREEVEPGVYERLSTHKATAYVLVSSTLVTKLIAAFTVTSFPSCSLQRSCS